MIPAPPPIHPQPGFYELLAAELGFDPAELAPRTHRDFMREHNQEGWLGMTLMDFERSTGKFAPKATKTKSNKKGIA